MSEAFGKHAARGPIGVFDSGIGGLTVVRALRRRLPGEDILYFGDTARVPYGTKSSATVLRFSRECLGFLARRQVKLLVVACNTASAVALPVLSGAVELPLIGVIAPGVAAALERSRRRRIGVIGTAATITSGAYRQGLEAPDPAPEVFERPCPLFVPLAEEGWTEGEVPRLVAHHYLDGLLAEGIDALILGCTHYPLLRDVIAEVAGEGVALIDSGEEAARGTAAVLTARGLANPRQAGGRCTVYVSDRPRHVERIGTAFLGEQLEAVTLVDQSEVPWYER
ncbi:MAG: glutamate racemase [Candidatus Eisenbacteria sp.]|nr:glutamate racemase [Candidatus Eisenbacteria bacterium]